MCARARYLGINIDKFKLKVEAKFYLRQFMFSIKRKVKNAKVTLYTIHIVIEEKKKN